MVIEVEVQCEDGHKIKNATIASSGDTRSTIGREVDRWMDLSLLCRKICVERTYKVSEKADMRAYIDQ